jgi:hypothetical protein
MELLSVVMPLDMNQAPGSPMLASLSGIYAVA